MKRFFTLLTLSILFGVQGLAQSYVNYDRDSRWFIGLNAGGTWTTQTEVPYQIRGGYGLTFGKSFGMEENKIFSWDVRARFLHAQVQGQSSDKYTLDSTSNAVLGGSGSEIISEYQDSLGYFVPNYRSNLLRGSLELVLNTNRLRQRTGWNLSVFGGLGITGYHTAADLTEFGGGIYDYNSVGNLTTNSAKNLQDGIYETDIVGDDFDYNVDWMPSFGFGISKQIHPAVALGLEHKMTWTRTNLFDGMSNNMDGSVSNINDKYHYTAVTLKFHLWGGRVDDDPDPVVDDFDKPDDTPVVVPVDDPITRQKPIVDIYDPNTSPYTTTVNTFLIKANIYNVDRKSDVKFKQDGNINTSFTYNATTDKFEGNVVLHPGQNLFEITGVNEAGSDYEAVIIYYEKEEEEIITPPIVTITNPPYSPYLTNSDVFGLVSTVLNVDTKSQIHVYLNGINITHFSYGLESKVLNASLNLIDGVNTVTVTATNDAGSDSKTVRINYEEPETIQPPIVSFVNPGANPHYTSVGIANIKATALNVETKGDLTILANGNLVSSFSFNTVTKEIIFSTALMEGANNIEITGVNAAGYDMANTTIIYTKPETPKPPIVTFIDPGTSPITVYSSTYNVTTRVLNVDSKADISLSINGVSTTSFAYSTSSDLMNFTTSLVEGSNVIEVRGTNKYGSDIETTTIIYKRTIPQAPPIVNITYPAADNQVFESPGMTLVASVLNVASAANINVLVNGTVTTDFAYNTSTKVLNLPLLLNEGSNVIQITGTNVSGSDTKNRFIIYKKPVVPTPPTVDFINPPSSPFVVTVPTYSITASTTHIDSKGQIVFKQNGVVIPSGSYSFVGGHQLIYNATLISGNNIFEVMVTNADGSDTDLAIVTLDIDEEPCIIPTVGYIHPVPYSTVADPAVTIDAQINNHSPETTVELKLNGVSKGYMSYNDATSIAAKDIVLNEGSNAINVIVTNDCGTNQATFTLNYEAPDAPCLDPTLSTIGATSFSTLEEEVALTLSSTHVENADEISVKVNGAVVPFMFDAATGSITINDISLNIGTNSVVVSATTECGTAIQVYTITRNECKLPGIAGLSHLSGTTTEDATIILTATIANVNSSEISFLVNGISQAFSYNEATNVFSQAIALEVGSNTITLSSENACGKDVETIVVVREIPCQSIITNLLVPVTNVVTVTEDTYEVVLHTVGLTGVEQVQVKLNGSSVTAEFDEVSGNVTISDLSLVDGTNELVVTLINDCSKGEVKYTINYDGCKAPVIVINDLTPGTTVEESVYALSAMVTNISDASDISLILNGTAVDFDFDGATHHLTASLSLVEGANTITINANGCETVKASTNLIYKVPCDKITHTLMQPATLESVAYASDFNAALGVFGIDNAEQVKVKLNGTPIPFTFDAATNVIYIAGATLTDGANILVVSLTNECSSEVVSYTVNYDACKPPVITFGAMPAEVSVEEYNFEANVSNITNAGDISLLLNGAVVEFVFDPSSGGIDATMNLTAGIDNEISLTAKGCETASKSTTIRYTIPCSPISYTMGHPTSSPVESAEEVYDINLIAQHVSSVNITVTNNGVALPFTYVDNLLAINGIVLAGGTNTVVVNLKNDCSEEVITYVIEHNDCSAPEISLVSNAISVEDAAYTFVANVSNIESAEQLVVKLNGTVVSHEFFAETSSLTSVLTLVEGVNTIEVVANGCVTSKEVLNVSYTIPCDPVSYSLVAPEALTATVADPTFNVTLNTTNVGNVGMVSAALNGASIEAPFSGGVVSLSSLELAEGENIITITIGNECSSETITYRVVYEPCNTPSVSYTTITEGMVVTEESITIYADVSDAEEEDILFRFNGVAIPFEYDPFAHKLAVTVTLSEGSNEIEVIVEGCETVTEVVTINYDPPCLVPTYVRVVPVEESVVVDGDSYTLSLTVRHVTAEQITVQINGVNKAFTLSDETLIVEIPSTDVLSNAVVITLTNVCGTETVNYTVEFTPAEEECEPEITVEFSEDHLEATVISDMEIINVILNLSNGETQRSADEGGFRGEYIAEGEQEGECLVGVWVRSGCNVDAGGEPYGTYFANPDWDGVCEVDEAPCERVGFTFVTPNRINEVTTAAQYQVVLNTVNVETINARVNGISVPTTFIDNQVTIPWFELNSGVNIVQITLGNYCSSETVTFAITSNPAPGGMGIRPDDGGDTGTGTGKIDGNTEIKAQAAPIITRISPAETGVSVTNQTFALKAKVANVSSRSDIQMVVNGTKFQGFNYSTKSKQVSAIIRLKEGKNTVKIIATNGKSTDITYTIVYDKPKPVIKNQDTGTGNTGKLGGTVAVKTPELSRVTPSSPTVSTDKSTYMLKFRALNITSKSDITMKLNGRVVTNFSYSSSTKLASVVLQLKSGKNSFLVTATKGGKTASLNYTINYSPKTTPKVNNGSVKTNTGGGQVGGGTKQGTQNNNGTLQRATPKKPVFKFVNPTSTSKTVKSKTFTLKAKVLNVNRKSDIKLVLNGANITGFTFNSSTKELVATITLKEGKNSVRITANNQGQSAVVTYSINYVGAQKINGGTPVNGTKSGNGTSTKVGVPKSTGGNGGTTSGGQLNRRN